MHTLSRPAQVWYSEPSRVAHAAAPHTPSRRGDRGHAGVSPYAGSAADCAVRLFQVASTPPPTTPLSLANQVPTVPSDARNRTMEQTTVFFAFSPTLKGAPAIVTEVATVPGYITP